MTLLEVFLLVTFTHSYCRRTSDELSRILWEVRLQHACHLAGVGEDIREAREHTAVPRESDRDGTERQQERHGYEPRQLSAGLSRGS